MIYLVRTSQGIVDACLPRPRKIFLETAGKGLVRCSGHIQLSCRGTVRRSAERHAELFLPFARNLPLHPSWLLSCKGRTLLQRQDSVSRVTRRTRSLVILPPTEITLWTSLNAGKLLILPTTFNTIEFLAHISISCGIVSWTSARISAAGIELHGMPIPERNRQGRPDYSSLLALLSAAQHLSYATLSTLKCIFS